jgi:PAS domain S-box-containing protein
MRKALNTLILDSSQGDTVLLLQELWRGGFDLHHRRVDNEADFTGALRDRSWDIVLSDYSMPGFDALTAMQIAREQGLDLPFILVSSIADEDAAVAAMKAGASDFFSKDKLTRLVPAVERELREAEERRKRREAEIGFTRSFHSSPVGKVMSRLSDGRAIDVNARFLESFGYTREEVMGKTGSELGIWANQAQRDQLVQLLYQTNSLSGIEMDVRKRNGQLGYALVSAEIIYLNGERCVLTMLHDITERKEAEHALKRYTERLELLHEIDRAILRADQPQAIAQSVLLRLQHLMEYDSGSVTTFDKDFRTFTVLATVPTAFPVLTPNEPRPIENRAMIASLQENKPFFANDLARASSLSTTEKALLNAGIRSFVRIPLIASDRLLGTINFHSNSPNWFPLQKLDIATEAAAQMAIALHNALLYQQIQDHAQELERRVLERTMELRASEENLRAALAQEKELNELKTRFVSMVSHDFRTPLTIIQSNTNLLEASYGRLDEEKRAHYFSRIYAQIQRMVELLEDVLTFSRGEVGAVSVNLVPVDLDHFFQEIVDEFQSTNRLKHKLVRRGSCAPGKVPVDEKLLQQAIINLLTNAFKYSPEGSTVYIDLSADEKYAVIQVIDCGIGIPQADQPRLFEIFHRAANVGSIEGTGLGLAIVQRSVEAHGGLVEFESVEGKGTTFTVKIPHTPTE